MNEVMNKTVLIMAGGTGGHVFPALALAEKLQVTGQRVLWLGTRKGIEARLVPQSGIPLHYLSVEGVRGRGILGLVKAPFLILLALVQAMGVVRRERVDLVVGFGGFASGPGGLAAFLLRKPLVIHEQNAIAGTTNRLLMRLTQHRLMAFPEALPEGKLVGNPVRDSIVALPEPQARYATRAAEKSRIRLLVLGGSLGARAINQLVPRALSELPVDERPEVWHQAGRDHAQETLASYLEYQVNARVEAFIEDMAVAYAWADVIVCRAGALTIAELTAAGVAALLIPLPNAIDDHQTWNAHYLQKADAALVFAQAELSEERLAALLLTELRDRTRLLAMAENARKLAMPDASTSLANYCLEVLRG
jgi:UDP-N-acetylglucosamine--N-acetylmuramyl-(pentapeptide) pyrophosphoryl-undecaprenol N-acetylglucosamine transferase